MRNLAVGILVFISLLLFGEWSRGAPQPQSSAKANADTIQAITNQMSTLTSTHFAFIFNDSSAIQNYTYSFELCADLQGCSTRTFTIDMMPHIGINVYWSLTLQALYTTAGRYNITAMTTIMGPNTNVVITSDSVANIINRGFQ